MVLVSSNRLTPKKLQSELISCDKTPSDDFFYLAALNFPSFADPIILIRCLAYSPTINFLDSPKSVSKMRRCFSSLFGGRIVGVITLDGKKHMLALCQQV